MPVPGGSDVALQLTTFLMRGLEFASFTDPFTHLDMNESLTERFGRGNAFKPLDAEAPVFMPPFVTPQSIRAYVKTFDKPVDLSHWSGFRDIPSTEEINNPDEEQEFPTNIVVGPYESKDDYLERHYTLLREDVVAPLRAAVDDVRAYPQIEERERDCRAFLYEKVRTTQSRF